MNRTVRLIVFLVVALHIDNSLFAQIKVGDNVSEISEFALLELESTTKGLILPRLTSTQRDAAFTQEAPIGTMIYNTDENEVQYLNYYVDPAGRRINEKVWEAATGDMILTGSTPPDNPTPGHLYYNDAEHMLYVWNTIQMDWLPLGGSNPPVELPIENEFLTYTNSDGSTTTLDLSTLSTTDSQTLTVSDTLLSISNGNSVDLAGMIQTVLARTTVVTGTSGTGPQGPAGPPGVPGAPGATGATGAVGGGFLTGTGAPSSLAVSPTFYVDTGTGEQYYNTGGGTTWTLLPSNDDQQLTASALSSNNTMTLAISEGNTVTLDLGALALSGTDSQSLRATLNTNSLTIAISDGNTQTIDLSSLSTVEDQELTASALSANNTMTLAISEGNTVTLDLGALALSGTDSQTLALASSATSSQTALNITGGNSLSLTASGSIRFNQTGTSTLELIGDSAIPIPPTGTNTDVTLRWNGSAWVANNSLLTNGTSQATLTSDLEVQGATSLATTTLSAGLRDADGDLGMQGQLLSSTGSQTNWITLESGVVTQTTSNYTATLEESSIYVQPVSAVTITLPVPTAAQNAKTITIKRINAYNGSGDTLAVVSTAIIQGSSNALQLNVGFQGYTLQAFGGAWFIIQRF